MKFAILILALGFFSACDRKEEASEAPTKSEQAVEASEEEAPVEPEWPDFEPAEGWKFVSAETLDEDGKATLLRARKAQGKLGTRLIRVLTNSIRAEGAAAAVKTCNTEVSGLRENVAGEFGVELGRTSFKLRNAANTSPKFMEPVVAARYEKDVAMQGPDGQIGWAFPLRVGPVCAQCHGTDDALAEGVMDRVAELYPDDQAVGFEAGALRGWIWVEAPPAS